MIESDDSVRIRTVKLLQTYYTLNFLICTPFSDIMEYRSRIKVVEGGDERTLPEGEDLSARKAPGNGSMN